MSRLPTSLASATTSRSWMATKLVGQPARPVANLKFARASWLAETVMTHA